MCKRSALSIALIVGAVLAAAFIVFTSVKAEEGDQCSTYSVLQVERKATEAGAKIQTFAKPEELTAIDKTIKALSGGVAYLESSTNTIMIAVTSTGQAYLIEFKDGCYLTASPVPLSAIPAILNSAESR